MRVEIARRIANHEAAEPMLDEVCERLKVSLTAREVKWIVDGDANGAAGGENSRTPAGSLIPFINKSKTSRRLKEPESRAVTVSAPTAEPPRYRLLIGELAGGRRLLSDDLDFLESVALMVARRIDAVRVIHERCLRDLHEQEMRKLATEAELRALRAQIKRHYGDAASFGIRSASGVGTTVELGLPINLANASVGGMTPRDLQQTSTRVYR